VVGLGARKNGIFEKLLSLRPVPVFPGTQALLERLRAGQVPVALATASRNARAVLAAAGLKDAFDVVVDGNTAAQLGLAGKPDPALFLHAIRELKVEPERAVVIEDAVAGVAASGERMPRKSTLFTPKPRTGLVLRDHRDA